MEEVKWLVKAEMFVNTKPALLVKTLKSMGFKVKVRKIIFEKENEEQIT